MQQNRQHKFQTSQSAPVGEFVKTIFDSYHETFENQSVIVDFDFENVTAPFDVQLIKEATRSLIQNAIEKMPNGGTISATLIDGQHQWELEIADSSGAKFNPFDEKAKPERQTESSDSTAHDLPVIIPFPESDSLRNAHRSAIAHHGHIQTWDCPQGGTAHVLVIPKRAHRSPN